MKKIPILVILIAALFAASCSKKSPDFVNTIPDNAFAIMSMHPQQIFDKGQINTFENMKKEIRDEFILNLLDHPEKSGLMLNEYSYVFVYFKDEAPMVGFVAGIANKEDFESVVEKIKEEEGGEFIDNEEFTLYFPDDEVAVAWNSDQVLFLGAMDHELSEEALTAEVSRLLNLEKEDAITSMVDFNDFSGKMKDLNIWVSSDEARKMMETMDAMKNMDFNLPMNLYNNYAQIFFEFEDGVMYMNTESHFSEEVTKNVEQFMVIEPKINDNLLEITPGDDLLMALAISLDLKKFKEMMNKMDLAEMSGVGDKIEETLGVSGNEIWEALSGDFVLAINGTEDGGMIPVEALIGIGLNDESLQKKLMGTVGGMVPVEDKGDFFLIKTQGLEIYSGIVEDIWVITNAKGYKDDIAGNGLSNSLKDSKFMDYAGGGMGLYFNLDFSTYPVGLQTMVSQKAEVAEMLELVTESLVSLGMEQSQYESKMTLLTAKKNENSLYTILKLADDIE